MFYTLKSRYYSAQIIEVDDGYRLELTRSFIYEKDEVWKRAILLHEVGHIYSSYQESPLDELRAQLWAIEKARLRRWTRIETMLVRMIREDWAHLFSNENKNHRLASKEYRRLERIQKAIRTSLARSERENDEETLYNVDWDIGIRENFLAEKAS